MAKPKDGQVRLTINSAYLAGPMRGLPEYNFPAFERAAGWLRSRGWRVESPHERDLAEGFDPKNDESHPLDYYMQFDLAMVSRTDCVILLPSWENSQGARLEAMVAVELGHPVFEITGPQGTALAGWDSQDWQLTGVEPAYVKAVFLTESMGWPEPEHVTSEEEKCWCEPRTERVDPRDLTVNDLVEAGLQVSMVPAGTMPTDSAGRKSLPITTGVLDYFPAALIEVAKVSKAGNDKHNPGQPLHHARGKSTDHADSLLRHLIDRGKVDADTGCRHSAEVAWRALALLQQELEDEGAPLARGARLPEEEL